MSPLVRPELPTASAGSSQAPTAAVDNSAPFANRPLSTYESGFGVQTSGATSDCRSGPVSQVAVVRPPGRPPGRAVCSKVGGMKAHWIVVMGVSGCGKSSLGAALAGQRALPLIEGDDFHAATSVAKMSAGIPLDDADRIGWLDTLGRQMSQRRHGAVLTCSALKRDYRERLRAAVPDLRFVFLKSSRATRPSAAWRGAPASTFFRPAWWPTSSPPWSRLKASRACWRSTPRSRPSGSARASSTGWIQSKKGLQRPLRLREALQKR